MKDILLIKVDDIPKYTAISGNIDLDRITPHVRLAQRTEIKRVLGVDLYNKVVKDFASDSLKGIYKTIYDEFVVDLLVNYSAYHITIFNTLRVDNAGNFYYEPDDARSADVEDTEKIASRYQKIAASIELEFSRWLRTNKVPERLDSGDCNNSSNSFKMSWFL